MTVGPIWGSVVSMKWNIIIEGGFQERYLVVYPVAVWILLGLVAPSVKQDCSTFFLCARDDFLDPLFGLWTDQWTEIGTFFESTVDVQLLCSLRYFWQPVFRFPYHDERAQCHASLTSGSKGCTGDSVQSVILVAVRHHGGVIFGSQVGLNSLPLR